MGDNERLLKKRILFLVSSMEGGGAERVASLLCNYWVQNGHFVTLMPTFSGRGDCQYPLDAQVNLSYLADHTGSTSRSFFNKLRRLICLRRAIFTISPDVVVSFLPPVNLAAILATIGTGVDVVVSERTYPPAMPLGSVMGKLRKWLYPRAKLVVVQTEQARNWLRVVGLNPLNSAVIPNPVVWPLPKSKPEVLPELVVNDRRKICLAVGRLGEEKGFDHLLRAFSNLTTQYSDWDLVILGEGCERVSLESLRNDLGLDGRVHLPGRVGNLSDWYNKAELFVMSSRFEGFPNVLLEAMAHSLPVVSFDCIAGPRDIIRHEIDGILVPVESGVEGLTTSISRLMDSEKQRKAMGQRALEVRERFSMTRVAGLWNEVLELGSP